LPPPQHKRPNNRKNIDGRNLREQNAGMGIKMKTKPLALAVLTFSPPGHQHNFSILTKKWDSVRVYDLLLTKVLDKRKYYNNTRCPGFAQARLLQLQPSSD
jgi:hypothetical protein